MGVGGVGVKLVSCTVFHSKKQTYIQNERQAERQKGRQTERQTDRKTERQRDIRQKDRHTRRSLTSHGPSERRSIQGSVHQVVVAVMDSSVDREVEVGHVRSVVDVVHVCKGLL